MQQLPQDPGLPFLAADSSRALEDLLAHAGIDEPIAEYQLLRHRPGRRLVARVRTSNRQVAIKAYGAGRAERHLAMLRSLERQGLASGNPPTLPRPMLIDDRRAVVVSPWLAAPTAWDLIAGGRGSRAGQLAAEWLGAVAGRDQPGARGHEAGDMLKRAERWVALLDKADPALGRRARRLLDALGRTPPPSRPTSLLHGELSPSHVLDLGAGPGIVDWDTMGTGPLELDAALFATSALLHPGLDEGASEEAQRAAARLFEELAGAIDDRALAWHRGLAALQFAKPFARRRPRGWRQAVTAALDHADAVITSR